MIRHGYAAANELKLHYAASGPEDAPLILFLHGYPEFWHAWRHQLEDLGDAFHCVAPDLPGYNLSSRPADVARYRTKRLILEAYDAMQQAIETGAPYRSPWDSESPGEEDE